MFRDDDIWGEINRCTSHIINVHFYSYEDPEVHFCIHSYEGIPMTTTLVKNNNENTCRHANTPTYTHKSSTCLHTWRHRYMNTYSHTYIHPVYIH